MVLVFTGVSCLTRVFRTGSTLRDCLTDTERSEYENVIKKKKTRNCSIMLAKRESHATDTVIVYVALQSNQFD